MCNDWQLCLEEHIVENDYQLQPFHPLLHNKVSIKKSHVSFTTTAAVPTNVEWQSSVLDTKRVGEKLNSKIEISYND
jgi:hypothetical protein